MGYFKDALGNTIPEGTTLGSSPQFLLVTETTKKSMKCGWRSHPQDDRTGNQEMPIKSSEDSLFYLWGTIVVYSVLSNESKPVLKSAPFGVILWHWWSTLTNLSPGNHEAALPKAGYCKTWNLRCPSPKECSCHWNHGGRSRNAKQKRVELPQNWRIWFQALHSGPFDWK